MNNNNYYDTEIQDSDEEDNKSSVASLMGSIKSYSNNRIKTFSQKASLAEKNPFTSNFSTQKIKTEKIPSIPENLKNLKKVRTAPQDIPISSDFDINVQDMIKAPLNKPKRFQKKDNFSMSNSGNILENNSKKLTKNSFRSNFKDIKKTEGEISRYSQTKKSLKFTGEKIKNSVEEIVKTLNSLEESGDISVDSGNREKISLIDYREIKKEEIFTFDLNIVISYIMQELGEEFSFAELKKVFLPKKGKASFRELAFFRHYEIIFFPDGDEEEEGGEGGEEG